MAFDQPTRNRLAAFVTSCRKLLSEEFTRQLRNVYGMDPKTGDVAEIDTLPTMGESDRQTARILRETMQHYLASSPKQDKKTRAAVIDRIVREQAFTVLNRLCAVRMAEAREIFIESIAKGTQSKGFKLYQALAGTGLGETGESYIVYLFSVFDEFALDLPVLFGRFSENGRLFPSMVVLDKLLEEINHHDLEDLWGEDETIGWIYQYFNSNEERRAMRDASQAPRNSRELAVRNQFFTPRYVVEFLTDNTLGRIWYEMRMGQTRLVDTCQYLVRRPDEVFLSASTAKPEDKASYFDDGVIEAARLLIEGVDPAIHEGQSYDDKTEEEIEALHANDFPAFSAENDDEISRMVALAHCVDSYASGTEFNTRSEDVESRRFDNLTTQEILEHLFITARSDRHGGDGECYRQTWFAEACNEVRRRALRSREDDLSQEELLRQPVFIAHRRLKDPREIRMIDPACGSMHFGLYAFDLFLQIYEEYWDAIVETEKEDHVPLENSRPKLKDFYANKAGFLRDVPRLIIEHNIHGVDIDRRAVQIAGLSLWLRAQRAWKDAGVKVGDRPVIERSNIVCAEPMPGDDAQLEEFIERTLSSTTEEQIIASIIRKAFRSMKLAGDAGSLLQIEKEIATTITEAKERWLAAPTERQLPLLDTDASEPPPADRPLLMVGLSNDSFWDEIEPRIYGSLQEYATTADQDAYRNKLFAKDTANGFAFIDICRQRYDVALMNPPFGDPSLASQKFLSIYGKAKSDLDACFVDRSRQILHNSGILGGIFNRTQFFKGYLEDWRRSNLLSARSIQNCLDLGLGVLDGAMVETAAYTTRHSLSGPAVFISGLAAVDKEAATKNALLETPTDKFTTLKNVHIASHTNLLAIPATRISYWVTSRLIEIIKRDDCLEENYAHCRQGLITADNERFLRLAWEVPVDSLAPKVNHLQSYRPRWYYYSKGGEYSPYFFDAHLVVNWADDGREIRNVFKGDKLASRPQNVQFYLQRGITYTERTASDISPRYLPSGCLFDCKGPVISPVSQDFDVWGLLGLTNSKVFKYFVELSLAGGDTSISVGAARQFTQSIVGSVPIPIRFVERSSEIGLIARALWSASAKQNAIDERSRYFDGTAVRDLQSHDTFGRYLTAFLRERDAIFREKLSLSKKLESLVYELYELDEESIAEVEAVCGRHPLDLSSPEFEKLADSEKTDVLSLSVSDVIERFRAVGHATRSITKMCHYADRHAEVLAHGFDCSVLEILDERQRLLDVTPSVRHELAFGLTSHFVGIAFGRWNPVADCNSRDASLSLDEESFALTPPAFRSSSGGEPANSMSSILTSDSDSSNSIANVVQSIIEECTDSVSDTIIGELCSALGVSSLQEYFASPTKFFETHLNQYSRSRRVAPIYWPLSSGSHTFWLYYHIVNSETLFRLVNGFIDPKLGDIADEISRLANNQDRSSEISERVAELTDARAELEDFRKDLLRVAKFWKPNLNDGVLITAAPLWKFFYLPRWRQKLRQTWEKMEEGDYDWAHLSLSIWPVRVIREKCTTDRSIAIAHDMENLLWVEDGKWRRLMEPSDEVAEQIKRRQSSKRTRLLGLLDQFVRDHAAESADVLAVDLPEGNLDNTQVALALWPTRVGEKCWTDLNLSQALGIDHNSRSRSQAAKQKLIKRLETVGCEELAEAFSNTFAGATGTVEEAWSELANGNRDDAPLAIELWPERVVPKCAEDVDLAITHGIKRFLWTRHPAQPDDEAAPYRQRQAIETEIKNEIARVEAL